MSISLISLTRLASIPELWVLAWVRFLIPSLIAAMSSEVWCGGGDAEAGAVDDGLAGRTAFMLLFLGDGARDELVVGGRDADPPTMYSCFLTVRINWLSISQISLRWDGGKSAAPIGSGLQVAESSLWWFSSLSWRCGG